MRILYAGHAYTIRANQAKLASLASQPNVELMLLTPDHWKGVLYDNPTDQYSEAPPIDHRSLRARLIGKESRFFYSEKLSPIIRSFRPDIIHVEQGTYALSYAQILRAALVAAPKARALFFTWWNLAYQLSGIKARLESYNLRLSSGAVAGNLEAREILRGRGFNRPIVVIPQLGVDPFLFPATANSTLHSSSKLTIGYLGRIEEEKGVTDLVEALIGLSHFCDFRAVFVGAGSAQNEIEMRLRASTVECKFIPAVRNEAIPPILQALNILVLPSRTSVSWKEQFGHILIEAMCSGVAVVGSNSGEIPNVIGDAGFIVSEQNPLVLTNALRALCADRNAIRSLSAKGRNRVLLRFTHEEISRQQLEFYSELISAAPTISTLNRSNSRSVSSFFSI